MGHQSLFAATLGNLRFPGSKSKSKVKKDSEFADPTMAPWNLRF